MTQHKSTFSRVCMSSLGSESKIEREMKKTRIVSIESSDYFNGYCHINGCKSHERGDVCVLSRVFMLEYSLIHSFSFLLQMQFSCYNYFYPSCISRIYTHDISVNLHSLEL